MDEHIWITDRNMLKRSCDHSRKGLKNVQSRGGSGPLGGPSSGLRWTSGKECLLGDLRLFPVNNSVRGRCTSPEKEAEEIETQVVEGRPFPPISERFSELESVSRRLRDLREARRLQKHRAPHGQPLRIPESTGAAEKQGQHGAMQRGTTHNPLTSQVPLQLQVKIYGQRGSLGISIAGGRGSLPYKEHDEGVFISRVAKGGPAEKAGIHIGDRVLEVNGCYMQEMTHHEAVCTLRNAGSCVKMKVLRERSVSPAPPAAPPIRAEAPETDVTVDRKLSNPTRPDPEPEHRMPGVIEAVVLCNGTGASSADPEKPGGWTVRDTEASFTANAFQVVKSTMTIPRIILTHPSTSDEDIEPLTHDPDDEELDDSGDLESHTYSDCLNNAFYPP